MKKIYFSIIFSFIFLSLHAQQLFDGKVDKLKGQPVICPADYHEANTFVPPPKEYLEAIAGKRARTTAKTTFVVTYNGFSPAAQRAFQAAVDIWAELIDSPVPIYVDATFTKLDQNVLGAAQSADFLRNFPGSQVANTWYPIALAERLARRDLNSPNEPDIVATFNRDVNWYLGQGIPGNNQFDFTSIVLHELCHGLGFTTSMRVAGTTGSWGLGTTAPFIFDKFIENSSNQRLTDTLAFRNRTQALRSQIVSNDLFFGGTYAQAKNGGIKPKLYAPTDYQQGSSVAHVDDATYPSGNINSLMTSAASLREVNKNPGPIVSGIFSEMGWKGPSVVHYTVDDFESATSVAINAKIVGDTTLAPSTFKLYYTENEADISKAKSLDMKRIGTTDDYTASIPVTATKSVIRYYISAEDVTKRKATSPPDAPRFFWGFSVGTDDVNPPSLEHYEPIILPSATAPKFDLLANSADDYATGIESVKVEYSINGVDKPTAELKRYNINTDGKNYSQGLRDDIAYFLKGLFAGLKNGDRVKYRIVSTDNSKAKNKTYLPAYYTGVGTTVKPTPDFYEFVVADKKGSAVKTYKNDFNSATTDFATVGFSITQPSGFDNGALHSIHPYKNGGGYGYETSWAAQLLVPIILDNDTATIEFDEIVLVEPGEQGSTFGDDDFYDYVVVEGSLDGISWYPFEDGYDATAETAWQNAFNSRAIDGPLGSQDSGGTATKALFKSRKINMLAGDYYPFELGDEVLIRFRLRSDQLTAGWGWTIDNLKIQVPPPPPVTSIVPEEKEELLAVSPNPTPDFVQIKATLPKVGEVRMEILGTKGEKVMEQEFTTTDRLFYQKVDIKDFTAGTYFVRLYNGDGYITRRFIVNK